MSIHEDTFASMGTTARLLVDADPQTAGRAFALARRRLADHEARLSRFRPTSELSALNADARERVAASPLLCEAVGAALWAARRTNGLVDPTLLDELEAAGYAASRAGAGRGPLAPLLAHAPARRPARPARPARWRDVHVHDGTVCRPPGLRLDLSGTAKGLAADRLGGELGRLPRVAIDLGGDVRVAGTAVAADPFGVVVEHPLTGEPAATVPVGPGAIATSGISRRAWSGGDGRAAHHLLDPVTGQPAWTGLVAATALAPTAVEAEALAKAAFLAGAMGARRWLSRHGGLLFDEDGAMETVAAAPAWRLSIDGAVAA
jgi:thiamine biosynthesis lipoprotein